MVVKILICGSESWALQKKGENYTKAVVNKIVETNQAMYVA
jgi:hypothetical protein